MYVRGNMNAWANTSPLIQIALGLSQAKLTLQPGMQQFKIADAEWKVANLGARFDEAMAQVETVKI